MTQYIITYLGGDMPSTPEEGQKHFAKYRDWLTGMGDAVISPANPLKDTSTIRPDGSVTPGTTSAMSGFTVIEVGSMDEALKAAKACPFLEIGGILEVSELMRMSG
ncbi:MAG: YciI family protein [Gammaproteobacteria bacterium]|nr:YciI family protein [Gammaproteobacteria bacterium]